MLPLEEESDAEVAKLIGGPGVHICDACVDLCVLTIAGKDASGFAGWDTLTTERLLAALAPSEASVEAARDVLQSQIDILRKRDVSWAQIGEALGISRQAAWERFS
jgi:ATP-dependent protease Clp ATPase subunit